MEILQKYLLDYSNHFQIFSFTGDTAAEPCVDIGEK